jgi:hypothetical protein
VKEDVKWAGMDFSYFDPFYLANSTSRFLQKTEIIRPRSDNGGSLLLRRKKMRVHKITTGFVIQVFDAETGRCVEQSFVAGDDVQYEDLNGNPVDWREAKGAYQPFEMV